MGGPGSGGRPLESNWKPAPGTKAWERQPKESPQAWVGFKAYRDITTGRTLIKAVQKMGKPSSYLGTMSNWSRRNHWQVRAAEWDRYQDRREQDTTHQAKFEAVREMTNRHLGISTTIQRLAHVEVRRWLRLVGADASNPDINKRPMLNPSQIQSLLDYAVRLERLVRNEPGEINETRTSELTPEEVEERIVHLLRAKDEK